MKVLITGGAGYVGYSLVKLLLNGLDQLHSITIYDNLSRKNYGFFTEARFDHKSIKFIRGDILDGRSLDKALEGIDCVVHLAAKVTTPYADHDAHFFDQVNHWGTAQLAMAVEKSHVSKFIYLSSMSVYGSSAVEINEHSDTNPHSFYGISKLAAEKQLEPIAEGTEVYIIRSGNVYGYNPSYRIDAVINRFMFNANFTGRIHINGNGEQGRSFIHVDKIAKLLAGAVDGNFPPGLYNAVEHNFTVNEVAGFVRDLYPAMDSIHISYNVELRSVITEIPCKVFSLVPLQDASFKDELFYFKNQFSF
jgi:UDP-glucose 4-epimerase